MHGKDLLSPTSVVHLPCAQWMFGWRSLARPSRHGWPHNGVVAVALGSDSNRRKRNLIRWRRFKHSEARGRLKLVCLNTDNSLNDWIFTLEWARKPVPSHPDEGDRKTIGRSNDADWRETRIAPLTVMRDVWLREFQPTFQKPRTLVIKTLT